MYRQNSLIYDEMYRTHEMHKMAKRCSDLAERCVQRSPAMDVDKSYAGYCEHRKQQAGSKGYRAGEGNVHAVRR